MHTPRADKFRLLIATLLSIVAAAPHAAAQGEAQTRQQRQQQFSDERSPRVEQGKRLLEQGDVEGAIAVLRPFAEQVRLDGEAWHLLGVAYARRGRQSDALKALGLAVAVRLDRLGFGAVPDPERFVKLSADERAMVKARAAKSYGEALESVEEYLRQNPPDADLWRQQAAAIKAHAEHVAATIDTEFAAARPDSQTVRLVINAKPDPGYTEEARRKGTDGVVRLRAIFAADGKVIHPVAIRPLPHGLTEKAVEAARHIRFQPATVDGRPVSQFIMVEYNFALNIRTYGPPGPRTRPRIP